MNILHVGLACSSEENADRFYRDLLALTKSEPKTLPAEISSALFGINSELTIINYTGEGTHFEVFIDPGQQSRSAAITHVCMEVNDLDEFIENSRRSGARLIQVPKGDSLVTFVRDLDGNSFEIKS